MEKPSKFTTAIMAFAATLVFLSILASVLVGTHPYGPHTVRYGKSIAAGIFIVVWWIVYIAILQHRTNKNKEDGAS